MDYNLFLKNLSEAIDEPKILQLDSKFEFRNLSIWDSVAGISVIAMIDSEYSVLIPAADFSKLTTIIDLFNYVNSKSNV